MYRSILVPLDGSAFGEHALPLALGLASRTQAELHLVHVHTPVAGVEFEAITPYRFEGMGEYDEDRETAGAENRYLESLAERLARTGVNTTTALISGPTTAALLAHSRSWRPDLLVMATHGRGPVDRARFGSIADPLVRRSTVPVLLVRGRDGQGGSLEEALHVRRVLVPLDGSTLAEEVLPHAVGLAHLLGAELLLLRALIPTMSPALTFSGTGTDFTRTAERASDAEAYLADLADELATGGMNAAVRVEDGPDAADTIVRVAEEEPETLIAMATHGRSGFTRMMLGSVTDRVVRAAQTPVFIRRPTPPAM